MKINGKEIKNGQRLTFGQTEYLEKRYEALERLIEKKYPVTCSYETSTASEAAYFEVTDNREDFLPGTSFSIRNHVNKYSNVDRFYWLDAFENWSALKAAVFAQIENYLKEGN